MRQHIETAMRAAFTRAEIEQMVQTSGLERSRVSNFADDYLLIERAGETDPNSWIKAREQYL